MNVFRIILGLLLVSSVTAYAEECTLSAGASDYAPLTYNDGGNNIIGLDVELVALIAKQANCKVKWQPILPWERVMSGIKTGELTITTSASDTPDRREFSRFLAYRPDSTKVFVRKEDLKKLSDINNLEDLLTKTNFTIGIYIGYHYGSSFERLFADSKNQARFSAIPDSTMSANFEKLQANRVDAVILETVVGLDLIKSAKLEDKIAILGFELDDPGPDAFANIMISKAGDPDSKIFNLLKKSIIEVQNSDAYKQVLKRYYPAN